MNRLYVAEPSPTSTGGVADERLALRSRDISSVVAAVADGVGVEGVSVTLPTGARPFVEALVRDLRDNAGRSVVVAGPSQPPEVHALVWRINAQLGNLGQTVTATVEPIAAGDAEGSPAGSIQQLGQAIDAGQVQSLLIIGGNPVYDAPADVNFAARLAQVPLSAHLSLYVDETSAACTWHLPRAHFLEAWGDGRGWDGVISIQQPLILPLFTGRTPIEVLATILGQQERQGYDIVRTTMRSVLGDGPGFETQWREALHDGVVADTAFDQVSGLATRESDGAEQRSAGEGFELTFVPSANVYDGRHANNGWLQELPGAMTKLTWDNAAIMNIADARELGLKTGSVVTIRLGQVSLTIPVYLMPGQARGSIALALGYGRSIPNLSVAHEVGVNVYPMRTTETLHVASGAQVAATGDWIELPLTQNHHLIDWVGEQGVKKRAGAAGESGYVVKEASLAEYQRNPHFVRGGEHGNYRLQMFNPPMVREPAHPEGPTAFNDPHAWGMTVDMSACTGCSACIVACQAENNIPSVGRRGVRMSREMHWLRIDRYFKSDASDADMERPQFVFMPIFCVHCENAPCESVCPVAATVHDSEGLNTMVYNRCIGTRYCSNNCPYKVRRFNYFDWHAKPVRADWGKPWAGMPDSQQRNSIDPIRQMGFNPDVTVRMRGVMEKCTYCTQRIARAKIDAKARWQQEGREGTPLVQDGEVMTACEQACPTGALVFGDLNDPDSRVSRMQRNARAYSVLDDLNTRPRTRHLAKIRNPVT